MLCLRRLHADRSQGEKERLSHDVVYVLYVLIFCLIHGIPNSIYGSFLRYESNNDPCLYTYLLPYAIDTNVAVIFLY